jgi:phosphoribosyl-dephospho-CoA transferase
MWQDTTNKGGQIQNEKRFAWRSKQEQQMCKRRHSRRSKQNKYVKEQTQCKISATVKIINGIKNQVW